MNNIPDSKFHLPTVLVVFGATGDLMAKKIAPALFHLHKKGQLPKLLHIIGFSRRSLTTDEFRSYLGEVLKKHKDIQSTDPAIDTFLKVVSYHTGNFKSSKDYTKLATILGRTDGEWNMCSNKLFYLAVPPTYYKSLLTHLASSGLTVPCSADEGWTRVIVEKPFGKDFKTAAELDLLLGKLFREEQIYRIDHYLGKEMMQNILAFRFTNTLLEESWNNKFVEKIVVRLYENIGVEGREGYYDTNGALRDVGQNHLLQMLAFVTMENPRAYDAQSIRAQRVALIKSLHKASPTDIAKNTFRAQYAGYRSLPGISDNSQTETYFRVKTYIDSDRWQGVPSILEGGKSLKTSTKEIRVTFKHPTPCLCPKGSAHIKNKVVISIDPKMQIRIQFLAKKPGLGMDVEDRNFNFSYVKQGKGREYVEEYARLLLDCIKGNQLLFISTSEIRASWEFIDPIARGWKSHSSTLHSYVPYSDKIIKKAQFAVPAIRTVGLNKPEIGVVGLGKMGAGIARQLNEKGWRVYAYNRTTSVSRAMEPEGITAKDTLKDLVLALKAPRTLWVMVPAGAPVDEVIFGPTGLLQYLEPGDLIVDAGNSNYRDTINRGARIKKEGRGVQFMDVGVSGGPRGARYGACCMIGGSRKTYEQLLPLFVDINVRGGFAFFKGVGAGHFVKMVHNGIEYGMMQAIAEGFAVMKKSKFNLNLSHVAQIYNRGSVVESRLVGWLKDGFEKYGEDLSSISATVAHTGEGAWTVEVASKLGVDVPILKGSLQFRIDSNKHPSYTGRVLSTLRNQFGGHEATKKN